MDSSDPNYNTHGNNTFLSRVFGVHSGVVTNSMDATEISHFPLNGERTSNQDNDLRIIESDQGSTSSEDESIGRGLDTEEDNIRRFEGVQSTIPEENEIRYNEDELYGSRDSLPKTGQGSSSESDEEDEEDEEDSDVPLFENPVPMKPTTSVPPERITASYNNREANKKNGKKHNNKSDHHPHLFQRIISERSRKLFGAEDQPQNESFLFRKKSIWDEENQQHKPRFNRPNLLNNIPSLKNTPVHRLNTLSPRERALWKWANVENLDVFLQEVYDYYLGNGFYCIVIEKILNMATLLFVVFISTYMGHCVDYSKLPSSHKFSEITIDKCYSTQITGMPKLLLWIFYVFVILKVVQLNFDVKALKDIHNFYSYLLNISDKELQTIPWQTVIQQIMFLKDQNAVTANVAEVKAKNRIDAHDVANRIMRKENYLIALYNKKILNLSLPVPLYRSSTLTKTLEWNLNLCIMGFAFNESGYLKQNFLKHSQREYLSEELKKRFMLAGFLNIILAPFLVTYFVLLYFFRYFNEYKTTPGAVGARQYTPIAEWKFREYNELYHLFQKRIGLSVEVANEYIDQFPKEKTSLILKFVAFVSGSFVAILAFLTIFDPENFLNFEITHDKSVLFYISIFGTVWAICKNSASDQYKVFDPEATLKELISYTHYAPKEWDGRYHTEDVKQEFCKLYNLRVILLLRELASLIMTPFILWFSLPNSAGKIVDFFKDVSVYVDGLGYVCKYAMFELEKNNKKKLTRHKSYYRKKRTFGTEAETDNDESESSSNEADHGVDKMMQSYMYFIDSYQNNNNAVGKHQLPRKQADGTDVVHATSSNRDYSWKKQFQPGQRPENFRLGMKSPADQSQTLAEIPKLGRRAKLEQDDAYRKVISESHSGLGESFINSVPIHDYNAYEGNEEGKNGTGVLGLLNQYYKKSDIGR